MIDPSLMPPLPDPTEKTESWRDEYGYEKWDYAFSEAQMTAYGLQCYQLAMERAADLAYDAAIRYSQGYAVDFKAEFAIDTASPEEGTS